MRVFSWVILILVASGAFTTFFTAFLIVDTMRFLDIGLRATAVIVEVKTTTSLYVPVYQFTDPRTGTQVKVMGLGRDWPPYTVGQVVNILYDPTQKYAENSVREADDIWLWPGLGIVTSIGVWMALTFLMLMMRRTQKNSGLVPSKDHKRYNRAPNYVFIGTICLFLVPMLIFLFSIGISIWTLPFLVIVCSFIIIALYFTTTPRVVLPPFSSPEEWNQTIAEMSLEELNNLNPRILLGNYRNHRVTITEYMYQAPPEADVSVYYLTNYDVEFKNSATITMYMTERFPFGAFQRLVRSLSYADWQREQTLLQKMADIRTGDDKFDRSILLKGNRESDIIAILDQSIRNKIMSITYPRFNLTIAGDNLDRASHHVSMGFSHIKKDAQRFRTVIDLMIDIVEKIEAYTPSV